MSDGAGGAVGAFVAIGVVYLIAEFMAIIAVFTALAAVFGVILVVVSLIYVLSNPIRTVSGWIIFLAGTMALISLPFGYEALVQSMMDKAHPNMLDNILVFAGGIWFIADMFSIAPLYDYCQNLGKN